MSRARFWPVGFRVLPNFRFFIREHFSARFWKKTALYFTLSFVRPSVISYLNAEGRLGLGLGLGLGLKSCFCGLVCVSARLGFLSQSQFGLGSFGMKNTNETETFKIINNFLQIKSKSFGGAHCFKICSATRIFTNALYSSYNFSNHRQKNS
jgi:hypothetical protein